MAKTDLSCHGNASRASSNGTGWTSSTVSVTSFGSVPSLDSHVLSTTSLIKDAVLVSGLITFLKATLVSGTFLVALACGIKSIVLIPLQEVNHISINNLLTYAEGKGAKLLPTICLERLWPSIFHVWRGPNSALGDF